MEDQQPMASMAPPHDDAMTMSSWTPANSLRRIASSCPEDTAIRAVVVDDDNTDTDNNVTFRALRMHAARLAAP